MKEGSNEYGRFEVWSTKSEDDEVRKPIHGGCFVVKSEEQEYEGRCLMVHNDVSEQRGYATDDGQNFESCFVANIFRTGDKI